MYLYTINSKADLLGCYFSQNNDCSDVLGESGIIFRIGTSEKRSQVDIQCEIGQLGHEEEFVSNRWNSGITNFGVRATSNFKMSYHSKTG